MSRSLARWNDDGAKIGRLSTLLTSAGVWYQRFDMVSRLGAQQQQQQQRLSELAVLFCATREESTLAALME